MEGIVGRRITDAWALQFKNNADFGVAVSNWRSVIKVILPISSSKLEKALTEGLKSKERCETSSDVVVGLFAAIQDTVAPQLKPFVKSITI